MRYNYECGNEECQFLFEVEQSAVDKKRLKKCPMCKKYALERILLEAPIGFVTQEPATILQQAERNTKKLGKYELESMRTMETQKQLANKQGCRDAVRDKYGGSVPDASFDRPWYGKLPDNMGGKDQKRTHKYIMEGK